KGKGILQEPGPVKKKNKTDQDQIKRVDEVSLKIQAHLDEEARTKRERQKVAYKAALSEMYDEVQTKIDADHELAVRLTHEEQEKYIAKERSKLLAEFFERRKKHLAKERAESMSFKEIQKLYIKEHKWVDAFVPIGSEEDEKRIRSRKKRAAGSSLKHKSPKKHKVNDQESKDSDKEHRKCLIMLEVLDRQDVLDLQKIIIERFLSNDPKGYDLILWGYLKTLVESSKDDEIWRNQQDWNLLSWKLYETCGIHTLMLDDSLVSINMFVEKKVSTHQRNT
nr:hypothetical protein [Tanacetum cinerariifolium]